MWNRTTTNGVQAHRVEEWERVWGLRPVHMEWNRTPPVIVSESQGVERQAVVAWSRMGQVQPFANNSGDAAEATPAQVVPIV